MSYVPKVFLEKNIEFINFYLIISNLGYFGRER